MSKRMGMFLFGTVMTFLGCCGSVSGAVFGLISNQAPIFGMHVPHYYEKMPWFLLPSGIVTYLIGMQIMRSQIRLDERERAR